MKHLSLNLICSLLLLSACVKDKTNDEPTPDPDPVVEAPLDTLYHILLGNRDYGANGYSTTITAYRANGTVGWTRKFGNGAFLNPYPADGYLYFTADSSYYDGTYKNKPQFHVLYGGSGTDRTRIASSEGSFSSPAARKDTFYYNESYGNSNSIAVRKSNNGQLLWSHKVASTFQAANLQPDGRTLYYTSYPSYYDTYINALDLDTRQLKWSASVGINFTQGPTGYAMSADLLYVRNGTGAVVAIQKSNGTIAWAANGAYSAPVLANNLLYSVEKNKGLVAINPATGNVAWTWLHSSYEMMSSKLAIYGKKAYLYWSDHAGYSIACVNAIDGTQLWKKTINHYYAEFGVAGNKIYALQQAGYGMPVATKNYIYVYDAPKGELKDSLEVTGQQFGRMQLITY